MIKEIETAIIAYIMANGWKIQISNTTLRIPSNAKVEYLSATMCPPYEKCKKDEMAQEDDDCATAKDGDDCATAKYGDDCAWEREYDQWKANDYHTSFVALPYLKINGDKYNTTIFNFSFVDDERKIIVNDLLLTQLT